jgi:putative ABC transport system ATP-binding protein
MTTNTLIKTTKVHKTYGKGTSAYEALRGIDIEIKKGEAVAIIGKSGSGKSTLMHLLAGLDQPSGGTIEYNGRSLSRLGERDMAAFRSKNVGFVFQQFFLQPSLTVAENVVMPLKIAGVGRRERDERAADVLDKVGLTNWATHRATDLSGGQKQRTAIARALITKPELIFADEPTGNLDTETSREVTKLLFTLQRKEGITLIVVTHDVDIAKLCGRIIRIQDGRLVK